MALETKRMLTISSIGKKPGVFDSRKFSKGYAMLRGYKGGTLYYCRFWFIFKKLHTNYATIITVVFKF